MSFYQYRPTEYTLHSVSHRGGRTLEAAKFIVNIYVLHMKEFEIGYVAM